MTDSASLQDRLESFRTEHRDLDRVISELVNSPSFDRLTLQRLKRRKLEIKDKIARLESLLLPDIIA
ncbi:MAG: DUF465 domain-containing protein [Alphaproteobacteria bacterium]